MGSGADIIRGLALVAFAVGGLLIAVGQKPRGSRCIIVAIALVVIEPLLMAGLERLRRAWSTRDAELDRIIVGLCIAAVVLAGLVALRRTRADRKPAEGTSQKKRVERMP